MKKNAAAVLAGFCIFLMLTAAAAGAEENDDYTGEIVEDIEFPYEVESAYLLEADTGRVVWGKAPHEIICPASITKVMTALLVMEALEENKISLEEEVHISSRAAEMGGTQLFLSSGDRVNLEKLLIGLMSGSANDAAVAVAEHVSGSVEKFVEEMNLKARELGMENTRFKNPHGLHHEDHYTTAVDIGIMSRELLQYPRVLEWATVWMDEKFLESEIRAGEVFLSNTNKMVRYYKGCDGLKTGFTDESGHSIVATAIRGNTRFIAVAMGAPSSEERYHAARHLLDYGFANYRAVPVHDRGDIVDRVPVEKGEYTGVNAVTETPLSLFLEKGADPGYEKEIKLDFYLQPPLEKGDKVGEIKAVSGEAEETVNLVAAWGVERAGFKILLGRTFEAWLGFGR